MLIYILSLYQYIILKELNIGLLSQISQLNQEIQALREANLSLLTRNAELEAKIKKTAKIIVNHHQLIIIKSLRIVAKRPRGLQMGKNDRKAKLC